MKVEVPFRKLSRLQAREIRKAITEMLGSRRRIFPSRGLWVIENPLTAPLLKGPIRMIQNGSQLDETVNEIWIWAGYSRHQRMVPTEVELMEVEYKIVNEHQTLFRAHKLSSFL